MIGIEIQFGAKRKVMEFPDTTRVTVGRDRNSEVFLSDVFASPQHAVIYREGPRLVLSALGTNPTWLNNERVVGGKPVALAPGSVIRIRGYTLRIVDHGDRAAETEEVMTERLAEVEKSLYEATFAGIDFRSIALLPDRLTRQGCDILRVSFDKAYAPLESTLASDLSLSGTVLSRIIRRVVLYQVAADSGESLTSPADELPIAVLVRDPVVSGLVDEILGTLRSGHEKRADAGKRETIEQLLVANWQRFTDRIVKTIPATLSPQLVKEELFRRIANLAFGLGPLDDLLENPAASEVLIVGPDRIYVEIGGSLRLTGERFPSVQTTRRILERAVSREGRRIDTSQPLVDAQLGDGSRLNAIISPLSRSGDVLTIRKFRARPFTLEDLERNGSMSQTINHFLSSVVAARLNVVIAGGTGSGKTTLLAAMASQSSPRERLVIIEDTAEIRLPRDMHVVYLQTRQANVEGKGAVPMQQLVRNALRMRPDRLVVGECRGAEVIDMLQAMNTGHPGSFTTIHANSSEEAVSRIEVMVLQGMELPMVAVRRQIASAVDVIVQVGRVPDGERRILNVSEVVEYDERRDMVVVQPIFQWDSVAEAYRFSGWMPSFIDQLIREGHFAAEGFLE